jgi:hypothetical protein
MGFIMVRIARSVCLVFVFALAVLLVTGTAAAAPISGRVIDPAKVAIPQVAVACQDEQDGRASDVTTRGGGFALKLKTAATHIECTFTAPGYLLARLTLKLNPDRFLAGDVVLQPAIEPLAPPAVSSTGGGLLVDTAFINKSTAQISLVGFSLVVDLPSERTCFQGEVVPELVLMVTEVVGVTLPPAQQALTVPFSPPPPTVKVTATFNIAYDPCLGGTATIRVPHPILIAPGDSRRVAIMSPPRTLYKDPAGRTRELTVTASPQGQALAVRAALGGSGDVSLGAAQVAVRFLITP